MKLIANLKNLFLKTPKERRIDFNRQRAEDEAQRAVKYGRKVHAFGGFRARNLQAIFIPSHGMFKGYMRENRRSTFNKNK